MRKNQISPRGFKNNKLLAVSAIVLAIALLLMIEAVAEVVVSAGNKLGVPMPPVPVFRNAAANVVLVAAGVFFLVISAVLVVPVVKFAVIGAGLALAGYGVYQLYKLVKGDMVQDLTPRK